jgi:hypothetical protein
MVKHEPELHSRRQFAGPGTLLLYPGLWQLIRVAKVPLTRVEPRGLEPLTPCLQNGGAGVAGRRLCLASREDSHPPPPGCVFVAAVCCCRFARERAPWLSTRPAPSLDRSGPTRSPIMIGNVVSGGTYRSLAGSISWSGWVWTQQRPEVQRERQDGDRHRGDRQCRSHARFSPCEVWLRYHRHSDDKGNHPRPREIHIQLVNEMPRVKACARLLLPSRNAGRERGVPCRTPSAPRSRDSS